MYRDLDSNLQAMLKNMLNWGYIYIGRTGVGLTYSFKREYYKKSGKALEDAKQWLSDQEIELLTVVCFEGPKYVPYKRMEDVLYRTTTITNPPPVAQREVGKQQQQ